MWRSPNKDAVEQCERQENRPSQDLQPWNTQNYKKGLIYLESLEIIYAEFASNVWQLSCLDIQYTKWTDLSLNSLFIKITIIHETVEAICLW